YADTGVDYGKGEYLIRLIQNLVTMCPAECDRLDSEGDLPFFSELERIREKILQNLLQPLLVREYRFRHPAPNIDRKRQTFRVRDGLKVLLNELAHLVDENAPALDLHRSRFDAGQIEDLIDQLKQIVARGVNRLGVLHLFGVEIPSVIFR